MAKSLAHRWGQVIGEVLEESIVRRMASIASANSLYLDFKKERKARPGKKVSWEDRYGNTHDLDYVLECDGTESVRGLPAAFIEIAWRRYTKHSRNKSQEIEGAILPLADTYKHCHPFLGVILAGVFTKGSLDQLKSRGFNLLYIPYGSMIKAFASAGIDASFDEDTAESAFRKKIDLYAALSTVQVRSICDKLLALEKEAIDVFFEALSRALRRKIKTVAVTVLHGDSIGIASVWEAIQYIQTYSASLGKEQPLVRFEVDIRYSNGDVIHATFQSKTEAVQFLKAFT